MHLPVSIHSKCSLSCPKLWVFVTPILWVVLRFPHHHHTKSQMYEARLICCHCNLHRFISSLRPNAVIINSRHQFMVTLSTADHLFMQLKVAPQIMNYLVWTQLRGGGGMCVCVFVEGGTEILSVDLVPSASPHHKALPL